MMIFKLRVRLRARREAPAEDETPLHNRTRKAQYMEKYRKKLKKTHNDKWELLKENEKMRVATYRRNMSSEQKKRYNDQAKNRMQKYRERQKEKKEENECTGNALQPLSRAAEEKKCKCKKNGKLQRENKELTCPIRRKEGSEKKMQKLSEKKNHCVKDKKQSNEETLQLKHKMQQMLCLKRYFQQKKPNEKPFRGSGKVSRGIHIRV